MTEPTASAPEVRDLTKHREPIAFMIDGDIFKAPPIISPIVLARIAKQFAGLQEGGLGIGGKDPDAVLNMMQSIAEIFRTMMPGPSGQRFSARMMADGSDEETQPIDLMAEVIPAFYYLLERYGLRPTEPSSDLESASMTGASGDGAQPAESTGEDSTVSPPS